MKSALIVAGLSIAAATMPISANAQDDGQVPSIVVTAENQDRWADGSRIEADGLRNLERAHTRLIDSSARVVNAQNMRDSALARSENALSEFRRLTTNMTEFVDPREAVRWARQVQSSADDWRRFESRHAEGLEDFEDAVEAQTNAQRDVDQAQAKIDRGRAMKAEAERRSAPRNTAEE